MPSVASIGLPVQGFVDKNGKPAANGRCYTYLAGTTTPAPTYRDASGTVANTNPIKLNERGECELWYDPALTYDLVPKLANGTALPRMSNIVAPSGSASADFSDSSGAGRVGYKPAWAGAIARAIADLFEDTVSVTTFLTPAQRADVRANTGLLDTSAAWQMTLDYAALKGKKVRAPAGSYRLDSPVTVTNADVMVEGDGQEVTKILVNNTTGGIFFSQAARAGCAYMSGCRGMTFIAFGAGNVLRGKGLSFVYPKASGAPATPHLFVSELSFRSPGYDSAPGNPGFTDCLYIKNGHCVQVEKVSAVQLNNNVCKAINLDYDNDALAYRVSLRSLSLEGHQYGVRAFGAIENLLISDYEIASPQYGIFCDASGVNHMTPLLTIFGGHVNATNRSLSVINWTSVQVDQPNFAIYSVDGFTVDATVYGAYFQDCDLIEWTGGIINSAAAGSGTPYTMLMQFSGCKNFTVSGFVGRIGYSPVGVQRGIQIDTLSNNGTLDGNRFFSIGGIAEAGIFVQTGSAVDDHLVITDNSCFNFTNGVWLINELGVKVRENDFTNCTVPVLVTGGRAGNTIIKDNYPANGRVPVSGATFGVGATPDGRLLVNNLAATTVTNITDGYDGMEIDLFFFDGNTTVAHSSTIFLQGSVAKTFPASTSLRLKYDQFSLIWYEIGRRT